MLPFYEAPSIPSSKAVRSEHDRAPGGCLWMQHPSDWNVFFYPQTSFPFVKVGDLKVRDMGYGVQLQFPFRLSHLLGVTFLSHIFLFFLSYKRG